MIAFIDPQLYVSTIVIVDPQLYVSTMAFIDLQVYINTIAFVDPQVLDSPLNANVDISPTVGSLQGKA